MGWLASPSIQSVEGVRSAVVEGAATSRTEIDQRLLSRSLDLHEELLDGLPLGVVGLTEDDRVLLCNRRMAQTLGRPVGELIGKSWFESVAPGLDLPEVRAAIDAARPPALASPQLVHRLRLTTAGRDIHAVLHFRPLRFRDRQLVALIVEDVSEKVRLESERDRLLAALFHDLRSPLSGISMFEEALIGQEDQLFEEVELREALRQVGATCRDMIELIDATTAQLNGGDGDAVLLDIAYLTHGVALEAQLSCLREQMSIRVNGEPVEVGCVDGLPALRVSSPRSEAGRSLRNLVANAVKYARSRIDLRLCTEGGVVEVWVEDDGPGVPVGFEERIFEGGVQAPGARPGSGLGLETVRLWAESVSGSIDVCRSPLGGARFRLRLPLA